MNWHEIIENTKVSSQFIQVCEEIFDDLDKPSKRTRNRNEKYINYYNTNWGKYKLEGNGPKVLSTSLKVSASNCL